VFIIQQPDTASRSSLLVEVALQNLLLDAGRIAGRCVPAVVHVDGVEFEMRLVHRHGGAPRESSLSPAPAGCGPEKRGRSRGPPPGVLFLNSNARVAAKLPRPGAGLSKTDGCSAA